MINLGKTYAKLMIFPKLFCKSGPWFLKHSTKKKNAFKTYFSTFHTPQNAVSGQR